MEDRVQITIENGVAEVRLIRADKMNALDLAMIKALVAAGERLKTEPGVRAIVLSGEGRAFCAGIDLGNFQREPGAPEPDVEDGLLPYSRTVGGANRSQQAVMVWREQKVPVIAAVHGVAFGGGFQLTLGADLRFVTADVRLSVMEIRWGLIPDMAGIALMKHLVRDDVGRELTYTGRQFGGEEAVHMGLATRVCADPRAEALALAAEIAAKSPTAIRAAKRLLNMAPEADQAAILRAETDEQRALIGAANQLEAIAANQQNRPPVFQD